MYQLVSRIPDGLGELRSLLESHINCQGTAAIEKCGEAALNVSSMNLIDLLYSILNDVLGNDNIQKKFGEAALNETYK